MMIFSYILFLGMSFFKCHTNALKRCISFVSYIDGYTLKTAGHVSFNVCVTY